MRRKKIRIPFLETGSRIPFIRLYLNDGSNIDALVDTGSESTLFDMGFAVANFHNVKTGNEMSLIGLSGETEKCVVREVKADMIVIDDCGVSRTITIDGMTADLTQVTHNVNERYDVKLDVRLLIGGDFLKRHGARIDYRNKMLTLRRGFE